MERLLAYLDLKIGRGKFEEFVMSKRRHRNEKGLSRGKERSPKYH